MRLAALAMVCAIALAACSEDPIPGPSGPVNVRLTLAPGDVGDVGAAAIRIRFQGVIGDSRCPSDVVCIQGGDAIVRIDVLPSGGGVATFDLHTGSLQPARFGSLTIALENLTPYPFSTRTIPPQEYRATLRVTR